MKLIHDIKFFFQMLTCHVTWQNEESFWSHHQRLCLSPQPEQPCHLFQEWLQLSHFSHQTVKTIMTLAASRCLLPGHWRNKFPLKSILNNVTVENCQRQLHVHLVKVTTRVICHWHPHLPHRPKLNTLTSQRSLPLTARGWAEIIAPIVIVTLKSLTLWQW